MTTLLAHLARIVGISIPVRTIDPVTRSFVQQRKDAERRHAKRSHLDRAISDRLHQLLGGVR